MRGYSTMTDEERQSILSQHKTFYNGYQVQSVPSSYQPMEEKSYANDMGGITVNNKGEVSSYKNYGINENYQLNEYEFEDEEPIVDLNDDMEYAELMSSLEEMLDEAGYEDENEFDYVESEVAEKYKIEEKKPEVEKIILENSGFDDVRYAELKDTYLKYKISDASRITKGHITFYACNVC